MLEEQNPGWRAETQDAFVNRLVAIALVRCDLCGEDAMRSGAVWTCQRGQHTLLHPMAYDVCDGCLQKYTGLVGQPAKQSKHERRHHQIPAASVLHASAPWRWLKKQMGACGHPQVARA